MILEKFGVDTSLRAYWEFCVRRVECVHENGLWPPIGFELLQQTPREDNSTADSLANSAQDFGAVRTSHMSGWNAFMNHLVALPQSGKD